MSTPFFDFFFGFKYDSFEKGKGETMIKAIVMDMDGTYWIPIIRFAGNKERR